MLTKQCIFWIVISIVVTYLFLRHTKTEYILFTSYWLKYFGYLKLKMTNRERHHGERTNRRPIKMKSEQKRN